MTVTQRLLESTVNIARSLAIFPYCFSYRRNTYNPIEAVIATTTRSACKTQLDKWFDLKQNEARYVQVAVSW